MLLPFNLPIDGAESAVASSAVVQQQVVQVDDALRVEYRQLDADPISKILVFRGDVVATYGPTVVRCRELTLDMEAGNGVATGGVSMTDPEGSLATEHLEFNWREKTGRATSASLVSGNVRIRAAEVRVAPDKWELLDASGTLSRKDQTAFELVAESVTLRPGRDGVARKVYLKLFGARLGPIPTYSFSLDKRLNPFKMPEIDYDQDKGLGVSWGSSFLVQRNAVVTASSALFPNLLPSYGISLGYSPLEEKAVSRPIALPNDLGEYVEDGWFNNIGVKEPEAKSRSLHERRVIYGIGTAWNQSTTARILEVDTVSKAVDIVGQWGGERSGFGYVSTGRLQHIRDSSDRNFVTRLKWNQSVVGPLLSVSEYLGFQFRLDGMTTVSSETMFGWIRAEVGALIKPMPGLTVGTAIAGSRSVGTPDFLIDPLPVDHAWLIRADYQRGPYTLRYLTKYDLRNHRFYSREYEIALVAEGFEPFIQYREFPSDYRIGIRFRLDQFAERLTQQEIRRTNSSGRE